MEPRPTRRQVLAGGAGVLFLAACGGNGDDSSATTTTANTAANDSRFRLVQFFGPDILVPGSPQRAPFGIGDKEGVITADAPESLVFRVTQDGADVGDAITVARHGEGLPRPYFPLVFTPPAAGVYDIHAEVDGEPVAAAIQVAEAGAVTVPQTGDALSPLDTPTTAAPAGVDPICTREPPCSLHEVTLAAALGEGRPVAFLVSTPKFCQTAICGPVLDVLAAEQDAFPGVRMVHAEVYTDDTTSTTTEAVQQYGLTFEPCLFLAGADGVITHRLDNIFDAVELRAALSSLAG